ncbi:S-layer homology domain-containing protein [Bacillus tianshenii]|nr:S-layer homology domain-containing protein [Bacillus tianshenii]
MKYRKLGVVALSSTLLFGIAPLVQAETTEQKPVNVMATSEVAAVESIDKAELIKRVREIFPKQFKDVKEEDFDVNIGHQFPENEGITQYDLHFHKEIKADQYEHGNFGFVGEDLELTSFYYNNDDQKDALFPPKVSRDEAEKVAIGFINKLTSTHTYEISDREDDFYFENQTLTEPVEYRFYFDKMENGVPVEGQGVNVTVLGNGKVTQYHNRTMWKQATFEKKGDILSKGEALQRLKDGLNMELRYQVHQIRPNEEAKAVLTYVPSPIVRGVHAESGDYFIGNEFMDELPEEEELKMVSEKSLDREQPMTKEEAKQLAEKLLKPESDSVKLVIEGVIEREGRDGKPVYSIDYMYRFGNSGHGSSLEFAKDTGELLRFSSYDRFEEVEEESNKPEISYRNAMNKAVEHLKEYAFSYADEVAYPTNTEEERYYPGGQESYYFYFPLVKNGIVVNGQGVHVSLSKEGKLLSFNVNTTDVKQWPQIDKAVSSEEALAAYKEKLDTELKYMTEHSPQKEGKVDHYKLVYASELVPPNHREYYDAQDGKWKKVEDRFGPQEGPKEFTVNHPWAAEELNFMIQGGIIDVENQEKFNPDRAITKGEALKVLSKSLSRFYRFERYSYDKDPRQTFENISPEHPLYGMVEAAVENELIEVNGKNFPVDEKMTREELTVWYGRILGLAKVAEHDDIYKLDMKDKSEINNNHIGDVALINALGVITADKNGYFKPDDEVTLAQLAVSNMRLAQQMADMNIRYN